MADTFVDAVHALIGAVSEAARLTAIGADAGKAENAADLALAAVYEAHDPPAPDAGGGAAFVEAVDRMDEASSRLAILCATGALEGPEFRAADDALATARAALLSAHAAAVQAADAAGYARAMRECSIAEMVDAGFTEADAAADVDARMARAAERTAPTLVNGGPPTDGLDDGR